MTLNKLLSAFELQFSILKMPSLRLPALKHYDSMTRGWVVAESELVSPNYPTVRGTNTG